MLAENPVFTAENFIADWQRSKISHQQLNSFLRSVSSETNRIEDNFSIIINNGQAIDPNTGQIINFSRNTYLERQEGNLFDSLITKADKNPFGSYAWISPSYEGVYPFNKLIFYTTEYTPDWQKALSAVAVIFDTSKAHCIDIAKKLDPSLYIENSETLRNHLFILPHDFDLVEILEAVSVSKSKADENISQERIDYFIGQIKSGRNPYSIAQEMTLEGMIGSYGISCPSWKSSFSRYMDNKSLVLNFSGEDQYGSLEFECPSCKKTNLREPGRLLSHCQHCGGDVRCS